MVSQGRRYMEQIVLVPNQTEDQGTLGKAKTSK